MHTRAESTRENASRHLMFVSGYVYRLLRVEARRIGIRWSALMVLVDLDVLGPTQQRTLVEIEQVRGSTMTVLLQEMEHRGWIERVVDDRDARVTLVRIKEKGRVEMKRAGGLLRARLLEKLAAVPDGAMRRLAASLGPVSAALTKKVEGY